MNSFKDDPSKFERHFFEEKQFILKMSYIKLYKLYTVLAENKQWGLVHREADKGKNILNTERRAKRSK